MITIKLEHCQYEYIMTSLGLSKRMLEDKGLPELAKKYGDIIKSIGVDEIAPEALSVEIKKDVKN